MSEAPTKAYLPSVGYGYARSRQLEGTFPRDQGCWSISSMRVAFGWGNPPESTWSSEPEKLTEDPPPTVDETAKATRLAAYWPLFNLDDIRRTLGLSIDPVLFGTRVTSDWFEPNGGRIPYPPRGHVVGATHAVCVVGYDDKREEILFVNSWGARWGDRGFGYLPYEYVRSFGIDAWSMDPMSQARAVAPGLHILNWGREVASGGDLHGIEIFDGDADERLGWALVLERGPDLHLFDLFVRPAWRRRGYARSLADAVRKIAEWRRRPVWMWVPGIDDRVDAAGVDAVARVLGLSLAPSTTTWVSRIGARAYFGDRTPFGRRARLPPPGTFVAPFVRRW